MGRDESRVRLQLWAISSRSSGPVLYKALESVLASECGGGGGGHCTTRPHCINLLSARMVRARSPKLTSGEASEPSVILAMPRYRQILRLSLALANAHQPTVVVRILYSIVANRVEYIIERQKRRQYRY